MWEKLKKQVTRGREEPTRTILAEARKVILQYGIELADVRIKRLTVTTWRASGRRSMLG